MDKQQLINLIVERLEGDQQLFMQAAKTAHAAAVHEENVPDNKYATLGLEASYLAQGQADRASELRAAVAAYRRLTPQSFDSEKPIRLTALVGLIDGQGVSKTIFLGPEAGGLQCQIDDLSVTVITPGSPLGRALLGKRAGDSVRIGVGPSAREYEIDSVR